MTTDTMDTVFGIPVVGEPDLNRGKSIDQRPISELEEPLRKALAVPGLTHIRWRQYTPYFNDGDVCEFGVGEVYFRFADTPGTDEDDPDYEGGDYEDGFESTYDFKRGPGHYEKQTVPHPKAGQPISSLDRWGVSRYATHYPATREESVWVSDGPPRAGVEDLVTLEGLIDSGAFEDALYDAFGDHAIVTVSKDKIKIERYDHD